MLLTRPPLSRRTVRLACVRPAASVRSEPGSNSQVELTSDIVPLVRRLVGVVHLRSLLTSSHSNQPAEADWISWCLSRDRNCQRRDDPKVIARTPPPAFLFPNQRCQRPEPACRPHRLAPGVGGGGYLVAPVFRVNRLFRAFFSPPEDPVLKSVPPRPRPD